MKKLWLILLASTTALPSFAYFNYSTFQKFDNEVSFGFNVQQGNFSTLNSPGASNSYGITAFNLEVEKLFDIGLWLDVNVGNVQIYTQTVGPVSPLGAYPFLASLNAKVGYNIAFTNFFALTPYLLLGKNANLTTFTGTIGGSAPTNQGATQDFFYTAGLGARLEFPINKYVYLFADQLVAYNDDQTRLYYNGLMMTASNYQTTSTVGVKVNLAQNLQLASNVFYNTYTGYDTNTLNAMNDSGQGGLPTTALGAQFSVGFTFK